MPSLERRAFGRYDQIDRCPTDFDHYGCDLHLVLDHGRSSVKAPNKELLATKCFPRLKLLPQLSMRSWTWQTKNKIRPFGDNFLLFEGLSNHLIANPFNRRMSIITHYWPDKLKRNHGYHHKRDGRRHWYWAKSLIALTLAILYGVGAVLQQNTLPTIQRFAEACAMPSLKRSIVYPPRSFLAEQGDTFVCVTNDVDLMTQSFNQSLVQMVSYRLINCPSFMMFKTDRHLRHSDCIRLAGLCSFQHHAVKSQPLFMKRRTKTNQDSLCLVVTVCWPG